VAQKDVSEETKKRLRTICAELDMTSLLHETFLCHNRLDEIARKRQLLVTKKRGGYAYISGAFTT
jgi:hypothetical protein